jgi:prolipoprotein diacylglyceryltransferase
MVLNVALVLLISKKFKYPFYEIVSMVVIDAMGIVFGGLLYTYIFSGSLGFSSLGGMFGGLLGLFVYSILLKKNFKYVLILFMPSIPLMYAIGKIGCFVAGCCHGIPYDGIGHIVYVNSKVAVLNTSLFPVQIVESFVFFIIFIYVISRYLKNLISIKLIMKEIIICGLAKLLLDFFRYDHVSSFITVNQIMCLVLILLSFIYLFFLIRKVKE